MNTQIIFLLLSWAVGVALSVDAGFWLLNQKSTPLAIAGVFWIVAVAVLSVKTRCFTKNPFKK